MEVDSFLLWLTFSKCLFGLKVLDVGVDDVEAHALGVVANIKKGRILLPQIGKVVDSVIIRISVS